MAKYYIRGVNKDGTGTIYFNIQKRNPSIRLRICTHINIKADKWTCANRNVTTWTKFAKSEEGKPIVDKLELMQQTISDLLSQGKIHGIEDKNIVDNAVMAIVNAEAIQQKEENARKKAEAIQKKKEKEAEQQKNICSFYKMFIAGIKDKSIRHGDNKVYAKTTIANWESFSKYIYGYCKTSDTFDIINKAYADKFCAYLEKCGLLPATCNKYIIDFRKLCNIAAEYGINKNATSLKVWKEREVYEEEKRAEIYLTSEELDTIYNFPLEGIEEQARDLFMLGYLCCQRYSDYSCLSAANFTTTFAGTPIVKLRQKKTGNIVEIPIIDNRIHELCTKYNYDFPKIDKRHINDFILSSMMKVAEVCPSLKYKQVTVLTISEKRKEQHFIELQEKKAAGKKLHKEDNRTLKNMSAYAKLHNGQPLYERNSHGQVVKFKYELITTHTARRSGVTNLYKTGLLDARDMMAISGHKTEQIFENYIRMSKSEHADRIAAKLKGLYDKH